jgi:hypothetical protein
MTNSFVEVESGAREVVREAPGDQHLVGADLGHAEDLERAGLGGLEHLREELSDVLGAGSPADPGRDGLVAGHDPGGVGREGGHDAVEVAGPERLEVGADGGGRVGPRVVSAASSCR